MIKCFCDICGKEFTANDEIERYKVKKEWSSWHESGWKHLDVHKACWEELCGFIKVRKERQENN